MGPNILLLNPSHSKRTTLDKAYSQHVKNLINTLDEEHTERWEIYSLILEDLINSGKDHYLKEIKYRLTDGEDPNEVILSIIEKESDNLNSLAWGLKARIEEYLEEDFFKRFLL